MSGRGHAFERLISLDRNPIDKRSSLVGSPIPPTVYETNAESCHFLLWHVLRVA